MFLLTFASTLIGAATLAIVIWGLLRHRTPILRDCRTYEYEDENMAHVRLMFAANKDHARITQITCPGYKLHHCTSSGSDVAFASPDSFKESLSLDVELEPSRGEREISFLISPIPKKHISAKLRIRETSREIKYTITQTQMTASE